MLLDRGIGVEAVLQSGTEAAEHFAGSPVRDQVLRVLASVIDATPRATGTAAALLPRIPPVAPVLLHGRGRGAWPTLVLALERGLGTRIGLEDTLQLPDGSVAGDNADTVGSLSGLRTRPRPGAWPSSSAWGPGMNAPERPPTAPASAAWPASRRPWWPRS